MGYINLENDPPSLNKCTFEECEEEYEDINIDNINIILKKEMENINKDDK